MPDSVSKRKPSCGRPNASRTPGYLQRPVFHTDGLPDVYHDQILVERGERRFCVVVINPGRFSTVEKIAVELNDLFGLLS